MTQEINPKYFLFLILIAGVFVSLQLFAAKKESLTWDEIGHYQEGVSALTKNHFTISPNSPTFIPQLASLPAVFGLPNNQLISSRLVIILLTVLLGISIYFFSLSFFDKRTALFAAVLFLFEPLIFAHAHYVTLDMGFSLLFFLAYWLFILFINKPSYQLGILTGFSLGLVFASKVTGIGFFAIIILIFLIFKKKFLKKKFRISYLLLFCIFILVGIWLTYRFTFGTLGGFSEGGSRLSNQIYQKLQKANPSFALNFKEVMSRQLPLGDFPRILKNALVFNQVPKTAFFLGEIRQASGFLMLLLFILKTPVSLMILFILGVINIRRKETFILILIPLVSVFIFVFFSNIDLRLRYLMPLYPFLAIVAARGLRQRLSFLLLIWFLVSFVRSFPHTISYANEISGLFGKPYLNFSDCNIDWGQGLIELKDYVNKNKIGKVNLSYYGIDDPNKYGFYGFSKENICKRSCVIDKTYVSYALKENEITAISITNWQECFWHKTAEYAPAKIRDVVGGSILIF